MIGKDTLERWFTEGQRKVAIIGDWLHPNWVERHKLEIWQAQQIQSEENK